MTANKQYELKSQWNLVPSKIGVRWNNDRHEPSRVFCRYNQNYIVPIFDEKEYEERLGGILVYDFGMTLTRYLAPGWTFEETKYLLELCQQFHLRFILVADRYEFKGNSRPIDEIKERFVEITNKLSSTSPSKYIEFNKQDESKRRLQLESFHARTAEQVREEAFLLDAIASTKADLKNIVQNREEYIMTYSSLNQCAVGTTLLEVLGLAKNTNGPNKSMKKHKGSDLSVFKVKRNRKGEVKQESKEIQDVGVGSSGQQGNTETNKGGVGPGRKPKPSTFSTALRSYRLKPVRVGLCRHIDKMLADFGLSTRPALPTKRVCESFDELRMLLVQLADLKKMELGMSLSNSSVGSASRANSGTDSVRMLSRTESVQKVAGA